jgi:phosphoesterase RecJ-like protein
MFELVTPLLACDTFLVVTHTRPDGDGIGAQLAMGRFLEGLGKSVILGGSDDTPPNLAWLDPNRTIETFDGSPLQVVRFGEVDAVVIVDANSPSRLGRMEDLVAGHNGRVFVIDHHPDPDPDFDGYAVDTTASSTGEIVYELIAAVNPDLLDEEIALCIYTAIVTDTGSFRYGNVTPRLMQIVSDLFRRGTFTAEEVYNRVYKTRTEAGQLLLGLALQSLTMALRGRLGYMKITRRMFERTGASSEDVDAFTDHILAIKGVEVAILFMEVGNNVKMSLRSQGDVSVNKLASSFGGGGHKNASGAFAQGNIETVVDRVLKEAAATIPLQASN